jgi:hypothetical protein
MSKHELIPAGQPSLGELAAQINEEHQRCVEAARTAVEHARKAGELLIQAKAALPHGDWLPWLKNSFPFSQRTAQDYMLVARSLPRLLEANPQCAADLTGPGGLSLRKVLKLLSPSSSGGSGGDEPPDAEPTGGGERALLEMLLPAPLMHYLRAGAITTNHVRLLLGLRDDYGPDLPARLDPKAPRGLSALIAKPSDAQLLLYLARVEDVPLAWLSWLTPSDRRQCPPVVIEACCIYLDDTVRRGKKFPQWEAAAFWWASLVVMLPNPSPQAGSCEWLAAQIAGWRERYEYALGWWACWGSSVPGKGAKGDDVWNELWWGYQCDLRCSASLRRAEAMPRPSGGAAARFSRGAEPVWPTAVAVALAAPEPSPAA